MGKYGSRAFFRPDAASRAFFRPCAASRAFFSPGAASLAFFRLNTSSCAIFSNSLTCVFTTQVAGVREVHRNKEDTYTYKSERDGHLNNFSNKVDGAGKFIRIQELHRRVHTKQEVYLNNS